MFGTIPIYVSIEGPHTRITMGASAAQKKKKNAINMSRLVFMMEHSRRWNWPECPVSIILDIYTHGDIHRDPPPPSPSNICMEKQSIFSISKYLRYFVCVAINPRFRTFFPHAVYPISARTQIFANIKQGTKKNAQ